MISGVERRGVGERIAAARRQRGMARKTLAGLVGRSEEWLRQIENGQRRLDSIECAVRLAEVLHFGELLALVGMQSREPVRAVDPDLSLPVRRALMDSVVLRALATSSTAWESRTLDADVPHAWQGWRCRGVDRYARTAKLLPGLVRGAAMRLREGAATGAIRPALSAYHLARAVLSRLGEEHTAWIAADRAYGLAEPMGGPALLAAAWNISMCYLRQGFVSEAERVAAAAMDSVVIASADGDLPVLHGALCLLAAEAAAGTLEARRADSLLEQAQQAAEMMCGDASAWFILFGPTEVGLSAVDVAIRRGRISEALRLAAQIDIPDGYPVDRQVGYYSRLAVLHSRRNEDAATAFALSEVAAVSPEDIRYDPLCRQALDRLLRRNNLTVRRELDRLSKLAHIS